MPHRVVIVQETVPTYRAPFFSQLRNALADSGTTLVVVTAEPSASDMAAPKPDDSWMVRVPIWGPRHAWIPARGLRLDGVLLGADLVVAEQALRHIETYGLLARQLMGGTRVALWGHGRTRVKTASAISRWALRRLTNRAHWFFAYTESARAAVVAGGFPSERVTIVQNSIDTESLVGAAHEVNDDEIKALKRKLGLPERGVCLFVGTLVPAKRLEFLLAASEILSTRIPHFTLVIAGDGPCRSFIERALIRNRWLRFVGEADMQQKALLSRVSDVMLAPGRVGLIAVDSFALETPIITTSWPFHSPEFEYLEDGRNALVTEDSVDAYARGVERILKSDSLLESARRACAEDASRYTLESMIRNFHAGVLAALEAPSR